MKNINETINEIQRKWKHETTMINFWLRNAELVKKEEHRGWKKDVQKFEEIAYVHMERRDELTNIYAFIKEIDYTTATYELRDWCDSNSKDAE